MPENKNPLTPEERLSKSKDDAIQGCLVFLIILGMIPLAAWWNAYVALTIYNWFLASIPLAPKLYIQHMVGFSLLTSLWMMKPTLLNKSSETKEETPSLGDGLKPLAIFLFGYPTMILFSGWLYQCWLVR